MAIEYKRKEEDMSILMCNLDKDFKNMEEGPVFTDSKYITDLINSGEKFYREDYKFYVQYGSLLWIQQDGTITSPSYPFDGKTVRTLLNTETFCEYYLVEKCGNTYKIYIIYVEPIGRFIYENNKPKLYFYKENNNVNFLETVLTK